MFRAKVVEKINALILYSKIFSENFDVCEIMCKNILEPDRPQM
jgi:hypothetical protein